MLRAVFLDRDGVICEEVHHLHKPEDIKLIPRAAEAIKILNNNEYLVIVITNQAAVAKGICTEDDIKNLHVYMNRLLKKRGAKLDRIYYCPHHPTEGSNPRYTRKCECRKPSPGMIFQAQKDFNIESLSECSVIGDKTVDIMAGELAGCKTILVETGYGGNDSLINVTPMFREKDLYGAVKNIILK